MPAYDVDKNLLIRTIHRDAVLMLGFYLGEELDLEIPEFHKELWAEFVDLLDQVNHPEHLVGVLQKLLAVPRDHAKTTLIKLAVLLFLRYSRLSFCAYCSNSAAVALNSIRDIRDWFLTEQDQELYGPAKTLKSNEADGLFIMQIMTPLSSRPKRITLKAFGWGTQLRGMIIAHRRPDIMIWDDIESKDTADSPAQQKKLDEWALGTARKAMAKSGVCIFIGNMISATTLLAKLSKHPGWNATVFGSIVRTRQGELAPLWPGRWTLDALLAEYAEYRGLGLGHIWEAEMMNLTAEETLGESLSAAIRVPRPPPDMIEAGFLCLDPAFGLKAWNDESAITVHVRRMGDDIPSVVASRTGRFNEVRLFDELMGLSLYWGIRTWVIETQAAQRLLIPLFRATLIQRQLSADLILMLPIQAGKESKASRILSFRSAVAAGSYAIAEEESDLFTKLEGYVPTSKDHDDLCDSAAYGAIIWEMYGNVIKGQGRFDVAGQLFESTSNYRSYSAVDLGIP